MLKRNVPWKCLNASSMSRRLKNAVSNGKKASCAAHAFRSKRISLSSRVRICCKFENRWVRRLCIHGCDASTNSGPLLSLQMEYQKQKLAQLGMSISELESSVGKHHDDLDCLDEVHTGAVEDEALKDRSIELRNKVTPRSEKFSRAAIQGCYALSYIASKKLRRRSSAFWRAKASGNNTMLPSTRQGLISCRSAARRFK